jgi:hypothetical protein
MKWMCSKTSQLIARSYQEGLADFSTKRNSKSLPRILNLSQRHTLFACPVLLRGQSDRRMTASVFTASNIRRSIVSKDATRMKTPPSSTPSWRGHYSKTKMKTGGFGPARQFATPTETPRRLPRRLRGAGDNALVLMPSPMKYARACLAGECTLFVVYSAIESV